METSFFRARGITVQYGSYRAVDSVDLDVHQGSIHSIVGPNGAGKTSLFNALSGLTKLASGEVEVEGRRVHDLPISKRVHLGIARSFQISNLYLDVSVRENVRIAVQAHHPKRALNFFSDKERYEPISEVVSRLLSDVALTAKAQTLASTLSHGEQRRLEICMALAGNPRILFLDEPTAGMGIDDIGFTKSFIQMLARDRKVTVLLIEHNMSLVMGISDRISVLQLGKKIAEGTPEEIRANPVVRSAYLGE